MNPYLDICSKVAEFNYLFGVIDYNYPNDKYFDEEKFDSNSNKFNESQVKLRFSLINEEIKELEQAVKDKNPIEIVDAICDILYVVAGAKIYFNLPIDEFVANEIKNLNDKHKFTRDLSLQKEDFNHIVEILENEKVVNLINKIKDNNSSLENLTELLINKNKIKYHKKFLNHLIRIYDEILDKIVKNIFKLANSQNFMIDITHQFNIVHSSNMTKVCICEEDAKETIEWYKINETRYKEPSYRKINFNEKDYYVVYDAETKKILKSIKYTPAKFI